MRITRTTLTEAGGLGESASLALAINEAVADDVAASLEERKKLLLGGGAAILIGVLLGGYLLVDGSTVPGLAVAVVGLAGGGGLIAFARSKEPDVTVASVEKRFWPVHVFPRPEGQIVYDAADVMDDVAFELELLDDPGAIERAREQLVRPSEFPVVMARESNVESRYLDVLETVRTTLGNAQTRRVEAPVLESGASTVESLDRLAAYAESDDLRVEPAIPFAEAHEQIEALEEFERYAASDDAEDEMGAFTVESEETAGALQAAQENGIELLNEHVTHAGDVFALSTYHFYCPSCLADGIETRLDVGFDGEPTWYCATCRESVEQSDVVPKHRIRDGVVEDVWDRLWIEKDDQRRRIYERIEDQKAELKEREFELRRDEIRSASDRIKDVRSKIRDLKTQATAGMGAIDEVGSLMVKYDHIQATRKQEFERDVDEAISRIDRETEELLEETKNVQEERLEEAEAEAEEKARLEKEDELRRERERIALEQAFAERRHAESSAQRADLSAQVADYSDQMEAALASRGVGR